ncbi:MAG: hypothetical protein D6785_14230 [Planctomycetota bacterium]|nr:MAG: hypothetical protein D6785_14230 [Planctomycetota bacterium]
MDKRRYRRLECALPVKVRQIPSRSEDVVKEFIIRNLGPEGAYITGDEIFEQDTLLELEFDLQGGGALPDEVDKIKATAVVRWKRFTDEEKGMGLQFLKVSEFGKQKISVYIIRKILEYRQGSGK